MGACRACSYSESDTPCNRALALGGKICGNMTPASVDKCAREKSKSTSEFDRTDSAGDTQIHD